MKNFSLGVLMIATLVQIALCVSYIERRERFRHAIAELNRTHAAMTNLCNQAVERVAAFQNTAAFRAGLAETQLRERGFTNFQYALLMKVDDQKFVAIVSSNKADTVTINVFPADWQDAEPAKTNLKL